MFTRDRVIKLIAALLILFGLAFGTAAASSPSDLAPCHVPMPLHSYDFC